MGDFPILVHFALHLRISSLAYLGRNRISRHQGPVLFPLLSWETGVGLCTGAQLLEVLYLILPSSDQQMAVTYLVSSRQMGCPHEHWACCVGQHDFTASQEQHL